MKHRIVVAPLAVLMSGSIAAAQPAAAEGDGCKEFGQNISFLARSLGPVFGQFASGGAPLNDTVEAEQTTLCN